MPRFFATGDSSSSESSSSEEEEVTVQQTTKDNTFAFDSSSSEEERRVIRSAKDKRFEALKATIRNMKNYIKINDWTSLRTAFELFGKQLDKSKNIIDAEGFPNFYLRFLIEIEEVVEEVVETKGASKMSAGNKKNFNVMKQKVRKTVKSLTKEIEAFKLNPVESEDEESEDEESEEESEDESSESEVSAEESDEEVVDESGESAGSESEESWKSDEFGGSDDEFGGSDDDSYDSDSSAGSDFDLSNPKMTRDFWVKKETVQSSKKKTLDGNEIQKRERERAERKLQKAQAKENLEVTTKEIDYTPRVIHEMLEEIQETRGKRNVNRSAVITELEVLSTKPMAKPMLVKVYSTLISAIFDYSLNKQGYLNILYWEKALNVLKQLISAVASDESIRLTESADTEENIAMLYEESEEKPSVYYVNGNLFSYLLRLSEELNKFFLEVDPHSEEYVSRLYDDMKVLSLSSEIIAYYQKLGNLSLEYRTILLRIEVLYSKYYPEFDRFNPASDDTCADRFKSSRFHELCYKSLENSDSRMKTRTFLCLIYHYCIHNHYEDAKSLLQMSHISEFITQTDSSTQILYNRTYAQLGLCAFRAGEYEDSLHCVYELYNTGKIKEMLGQGVTHRYNSTSENIEPALQVPFHLQISLDLLDGVHVLTALILEIPNMAMASTDRKHVINKNFRKLWVQYQSGILSGPADSTRECAMAAARALWEGDWKAADAFVEKMRMWNLVPYAARVKSLLRTKLKSVALRTYLMRHGGLYTTVSLESIAEMFDLERNVAHSIASRMIAAGELNGSWDQPSQCIVMDALDLNPLKQHALGFSGKLSTLMDLNERLLEQRVVQRGERKASLGKRVR